MSAQWTEDVDAAAVLDALTDAVLVTDAQLDEPGPRTLYVNAAFTAMTGWTAQEILGRNPRMLQARDIDRRELDRVRQALEHGRPVRAELRNQRKDGSAFYVEVDITPMRDEQGRVVRFVSVQREVSTRQSAQEELRHQAVHDESTGLLNRRGLLRMLDRTLQQATQAGSPHPSILLCDLAGLRRINSSLGRDTGDAVVLESARRMSAVAGSQAVVGRLESGEFVLATPDIGMTGLVGLVERLRRAMLTPVRISEAALTVSVALGIATGRAGTSPAAVLREADLALRAAKSQGRNRYEFYEPAMGQEVADRLRMEEELRAALAGEELVLHHQPIVRLVDRSYSHAEALLRWLRDGRPHAGPAQFVPVAEETGLIVPLGMWALRRACEQASAWQQRLPGVGVAVNLSPRQLADPGLLADVDRALEVGLDPDLVTLEVTESALLVDPVAAASTLHALRRRGLHLALDDFGTGYSSLAYLTRLPVETVKIDKSFVDEVERDAGSRAVIKSVLALADDLGLSVVAEGIETQGQADALIELGCEFGQGYLFARPAPADQLGR